MLNTDLSFSIANTAKNPTYAYVNAFVDEVQRAGLHNVVICPGSRSTPLAIAFASHPALKVWMHIDERSAAFFALGMAKRLAQPVALLCTSGTAAANFFPAIVEARLTHVPLLILTADRPPELRENGAPQAIDQNRLYGVHVKWFMELALPEATNASLRYIRTLADRATALTLATPAGPVHLNFPFREPLTPDPIPDQPLPALHQRDQFAWEGRPDNLPYIEVHDAPLAPPSTRIIADLVRKIRTHERGLIIAGPYDKPELIGPLTRLAAQAGYPILADPLSQLRSGPHDHSHVLASYDAFLRIDDFIEHKKPAFILRFGAMPTAKPLLLYMKRYEDCHQVIVDAHGGWDEPTQLASELVHADPIALCEDLITALSQEDAEKRQESAWLKDWQRADQITRVALQSAISDFPEPFEGRVFPELAKLLPEDAAMFVGNSMPVRDLDTFFWGGEQRVRIGGNRGANGIDGIVSSALGFSAGSSSNTPALLVIGDLSFLHDLNGLLAARLHQLNLVIVLINNDGGGIFSFLPQAAHPEHFEQLFGTPTGVEFGAAVAMYGGHYQRTGNWESFRQAVQAGMISGGLHVVEVVTERESNVSMHRSLWRTVGSALHTQEEL
ncbi:MAG: 2-succinyl-5-enolpyruvyl-6-hydroxy-3-cyclohexene-1-carboxylic-acid synthase [Ktedonobacteraceae bacterium]|nr:2-succinyl-5-enolpyruvyl-6-hydroxy-3-cyclohexene-1-carboxylic-acid synthase [Ktedonobacteraceae bacterium]